MILGFLRVVGGFLVACVLAAAAQVGFAFGPDSLRSELASSVEMVLLTATHFAIFAFPFSLVVAALGEWQSLRGWLYYVLGGLGIALAGFLAQYWSESGGPTIWNAYAAKAFAVPGLVGGLGYWLLAGRRAGDAGREDGLAANGAD